jgi:hypothetical protein
MEKIYRRIVFVTPGDANVYNDKGLVIDKISIPTDPETRKPYFTVSDMGWEDDWKIFETIPLSE